MPGHTLAAAWTFAALAACGLGAWLGPPRLLAELLREDGAIESATVVGYFAAIAGAWLVRHPAWTRTAALAAAAVLAAFAAKEGGLRRRLLGAAASDSVDFGAWPNVLVLVLAAGALAAAVFLAIRFGRRFAAAVRAREPGALTLCVAAAGLGLAQAFDAWSGAYLVPPEYWIDRWRALQLGVEEGLEALFPALLCLAALQFDRAGRPART